MITFSTLAQGDMKISKASKGLKLSPETTQKWILMQHISHDTAQGRYKSNKQSSTQQK